MPIYEYKCKGCGEVSEILVGVSDHGDPLKCQKCGSLNLERVMSASYASIRAGLPDTSVKGGSPPDVPPPKGVFTGFDEKTQKPATIQPEDWDKFK